MQVMLDTSSVDDRDPAVLRALAKFLEAVAVTYDPAAEPSINDEPTISVGDVVEIRTELEATKFFGPEESLPADAFERGEKSPPPLIPPPPVLFIAPAPLTADKLPPMPLPPGPQPAAEFDSAGVAYDANLHSSTKSKTIDGKWKARRNRGSAQVPAGTSAPAPLPPPPLIPPPAGLDVSSGQTAQIPPPPVLPPPASTDDDVEVEADEPTGLLPGANAVAVDFPTFITKITSGMNAGTITQAQITAVMAQFKLDSLFSLNTKPELVGDVAKAFGFA